jgi:hypothetical protein
MSYQIFDASTPASERAVRMYVKEVQQTLQRQNEVVAEARKLGAVQVASCGNREVINGFSFNRPPPAGWQAIRGIESAVTFYSPPIGSEWDNKLKSCSMPMISRYIEGLPASFSISNGTVKWVRADVNAKSVSIRVPVEMNIRSLPGFIARTNNEHSNTHKCGVLLTPRRRMI